MAVSTGEKLRRCSMMCLPACARNVTVFMRRSTKSAFLTAPAAEAGDRPPLLRYETGDPDASRGFGSPSGLLGFLLEGRRRLDHRNTDLVDQAANVGRLDTVVVHEDGKSKAPIVERGGVTRDGRHVRQGPCLGADSTLGRCPREPPVQGAVLARDG